jgi:hypothetical protein
MVRSLSPVKANLMNKIFDIRFGLNRRGWKGVICNFGGICFLLQAVPGFQDGFYSYSYKSAAGMIDSSEGVSTFTHTSLFLFFPRACSELCAK